MHRLREPSRTVNEARRCSGNQSPISSRIKSESNTSSFSTKGGSSGLMELKIRRNQPQEDCRKFYSVWEGCEKYME